MFTAIVLIPPLTYVYNRLNIVDIPSPRKIHKVPIPRVGGVAIVIATMIPVIGWIQFDRTMLGLLAGVGILFALGVVDDAKNLSYKSKFIFQIAAIVLIFVSGFIDIHQSHYVFNQILSAPLILLLYFLFILGVTNAINLADGLDGLAGGEALLSFSIIGLLAFESGNNHIVLIVLAIIGAVFGFLRFNSYPARIFMGDTGSLFLGFILGVLSVALTYGADNAYSKTLPLLLVGLPVFDTMMVMIIRLYNKQSPFNADRNHLHHKLLDNGFKHYQSVLIIYFIQSLYILAAYFMRYESELTVVLGFVIISMLALTVSLLRVQAVLPAISDPKFFGELIRSFKSVVQTHSARVFTLLSGLLLIYIATSIININHFDVDILMLLVVIAMLALIGLGFYYNRPCNWIERISIHIMIVLSIYFETQSEAAAVANSTQLIILVSCLGLILMLFLSDSSRKFIGSPLDFLLIATAIVIPNLPNSPIADQGLSLLVIKLIMLFYCVEYVLFNIKYNWWTIRTLLAITACVPIFINYI